MQLKFFVPYQWDTAGKSLTRHHPSQTDNTGGHESKLKIDRCKPQADLAASD